MAGQTLRFMLEMIQSKTTSSNSYAGTVTPAGAVTKQVKPAEAGSVTPSGSLSGSNLSALAGSTALSGALSVSVTRAVAGSLTPAGGLLKSVGRLVEGSMTPDGALTEGLSTSLTGSLTPSGALGPDSVSLHLSGTLTPVGAPIRETVSVFFGGISISGGLLRSNPHLLLRGRLTPLGALSVVGGAPVTPTPIPGVLRRSGLLGCGSYTVLATTRGGRYPVATIPWTGLEWHRVRSDTGESRIEADGVSGASRTCKRDLETLRPWEHEIAIYRSTYLVWCGPIVRLDVDDDKLTIDARDLSTWFDRRRIRYDISMYADLADIFGAYAAAAMASDPSPAIQFQASLADVLGQRSVLASQHLLAGPLMRELTRQGVDWVMVKRLLTYGTAASPILPVALLTDDSYEGQPSVSVEGLDQANDWILAGQSTGEAGDVIYGVASDPVSQSVYGLLDAVARESLVEDGDSANAGATSRLGLTSTAPALINGGTLVPTAPVTIDQLVPGVLLDNRLQQSLYPVLGDFRLSKLDVTAGNDGSEKVAVSFQPPGPVVAV